MPPRSRSVPAPPAGLWQREDMTAALHDRDLGAAVRIYRRWTGASQTDVGSLVGLPQPQVSEIERGLRRVEKLELFERFADGLDIPRALLGLAYPPAAAATNASPPASAFLLDGQGRGPVRLHRVDAGVLDDLVRLTDSFRRIDRRMGAPGVFRDLAAHLGRVQGLHRHPMSPGIRQRLAGVAADVAALLGWQALDMSQPRLAWQHFRTAAEAAREAAMPTFHAFVIAQSAYLPLFGGNARAALPLIAKARRVADGRTSSTFQAWLYAAEAEALTSVGAVRGALRALEESDRAMSRAAVGEERTPALVHFDGSHLLRWKGQVLGHLSRKDEAEPVLRAALDDLDSTFVRARAGLLLDLATCLVMDGEVQESCRLVREALEHAHETQSARYEHQVLLFRGHLEPWADSHCVRQLDEELAEGLPGAGGETRKGQDVQ